MAERIRRFVVTPQSVHAVCQLGQQQCRRVWETLDKFARDPDSRGLNREALKGSAAGLQSIRVDAGCRIIFSGEEIPVLIFAGPHDAAYQFAERPKLELYSTIAPDALRDGGSSTPFRPVAAETVGPAPEGSPIQPDQLKRLLIRTTKYLPLAAFLTGLAPNRTAIDLSFAQIETPSILPPTRPQAAKPARRRPSRHCTTRGCRFDSPGRAARGDYDASAMTLPPGPRRSTR